MHTLNLQDLPTELLQKIFVTNDFPRENLISIARVSRRFNSIAIPAVLALYGIRQPSKQFKACVWCGTAVQLFSEGKRGKVDVLSGLALGFDITEVEELDWRIDAERSYTMDVLFKDYGRLLRILQRLQRIKTASISFEGLNYFSAWAGAAPIGIWRGLMEGILNVLVERGCKSLVIYHGSLVAQIFVKTKKRGESEGVAVMVQRTKNLFGVSTTSPTLEGPTWKMARSKASVPMKLANLSEAARRSSQLQRIHISSCMLLHPPLSHWTYSILATPSLTSLTLCGLEFTALEWEAILSWLAIPLKAKLVELTIERCHRFTTSTATSLIEFIVQLGSLTHLRLGPPFPDVSNPDFKRTLQNFKSKSGVESGDNVQVLPNLVSLEAFSDWIELLLSSSSPSQTQRSNLKSLYIRARTVFFHTYFNHLCPVALPPVLSSPVLLPRGSGLQVTLDLYQADTDSGNLEGYISQLSRSTDMSPEVFEGITHLVLPSWDFTLSLPHYEATCRFFAMWKGLEEVIFAPSTKGGTLKVWEKGDKVTFSAHARKWCPNVKVFWYNHMEHRLTNAEGVVEDRFYVMNI
ncbi:hypothetical protein BDN72DRAFT_849089 [Pluteus cervinus]|uniref:Uncharacterized protein n=1 Tax=Pluteus cervinus TaxID=181527 RepID=A0ACD3A8Y3_9AGAR|nr:hypothetical protein BDN72DRAFT_849089 [Pluteus cervinus]